MLTSPHICWPTQRPPPSMSFFLCNDNVLQRTDTAISALPLFYVWIYVSLPSLRAKWWKTPRQELFHSGLFCSVGTEHMNGTVHDDFSFTTVVLWWKGPLEISYVHWDSGIFFFFSSGQFVNHVALWGSCFLIPLFLVDWSFLAFSVSHCTLHICFVLSQFSPNRGYIHKLTHCH